MEDRKDNNRFRITSIIIAVVMLSATFGALIGPFIINVSATSDTHVWTGGGIGNLASTADNWGGVVPTSGDTVIFDSGSKDCTFDLAVWLTAIRIQGTYSGTITQGNWQDVRNFVMTAPDAELTGASSDMWYTCFGNWYQTAGTITQRTLNVRFNGTDKYVTSTDFIWYGLRVMDNITVNKTAGGSSSFSIDYLTVDAGKTMTLVGNISYKCHTFSMGSQYSNSGEIDGPGSIRFEFYDSSPTISFGDIDASVVLDAHPGTTVNRTVKTSSEVFFESSLTVNSQSAQCNLTFDLDNYNMTTGGIVLHNRAFLKAGSSTITCNGPWSSSESNLIADTGTISLIGPSAVLAIQQFYNLYLNCPLTSLADLTVSNNLTLGSAGRLNIGIGQTSLKLKSDAIINGSMGSIDKYALNPVIDLPFGTMVKDPCLILVASTYYMAYSYWTGTVASIKMAKSTDFHTWIDMGFVLNSTEPWELFKVAAPFLYYEAGTYYMFYQACANASEIWSLGVATNSDIEDADGWVKYGPNPILDPTNTPGLNEESMYDPSVIKVGATYYLYYVCFNAGIRGVSVATSTDLFTWTKYGFHVFETAFTTVTGVEAWNIMILEPGLYLAYMTDWDASLRQICRQAVSSDLYNWAEVEQPIFNYTQAWESGGSGTESGVGSPGMLKIGDSVYVAYQGHNDTTWMIGVCIINQTYSNIDFQDTSLDNVVTMHLPLYGNLSTNGGITISSSGSVFSFTTDSGTLSVNMTIWLPHSTGLVARWKASSTDLDSNNTFVLSGLSSDFYRISIDDVYIETVYGTTVTVSYDGPWSEHEFEVTSSGYGEPVSGMVNLIFVTFALGIVIGVVAEGTNSLRKMKMRTTQQMVKSLLNMVIYIVIGIAGIGVLYSVVA